MGVAVSLAVFQSQFIPRSGIRAGYLFVHNRMERRVNYSCIHYQKDAKHAPHLAVPSLTLTTRGPTAHLPSSVWDHECHSFAVLRHYWEGHEERTTGIHLQKCIERPMSSIQKK